MKKIAITRSYDDSLEFIKLAEQNNIKPLPLPTIELVSKSSNIVNEFLDSIQKHDPDYSVFMSSKAVKLLFDTARESSQLDKLQLAIANTIVISVGPKTSDSLKSEGIKVNDMPKKTFSSVGIGELFTNLNAVGKKAIIPRSGASTPFLKELLNKIGVDVIEIYLYDVHAFSDVSEWGESRELFLNGDIDGIVFTSASSVRGFFEIMRNDQPDAKTVNVLSKMHVVAIGPFTADELKKFNVQNILSKVHTVEGSFQVMNQILTKTI